MSNFWPIRSEIRPAFDGGLMQAQYLIGGVHVVQNKAQRNSINMLRRKLDATTTTLAVVLEEGRIYKLINNPSTLGTTDSDWEVFFIGEVSSFRPIGEWDADNDDPVLLDTGAFGINGQFYFVVNAPTQRDVTYPGLFQGQTETVVNGDIVVSVGDRWVVVTSSVTWDALAKPAVIEDYVNGTVIAHTHNVSDLIGLTPLLDAKYDVGDTADHTIDFNLVPDLSIVEVEFLKTHYYTKDEVEDLIDEYTSGITTFLALTDTPSTYAGNAGKTVKVNATGDALEFVSADPWKVSGTTILTGDATIDFDGHSVDFINAFTSGGYNFETYYEFGDYFVSLASGDITIDRLGYAIGGQVQGVDKSSTTYSVSKWGDSTDNIALRAEVRNTTSGTGGDYEAWTELRSWSAEIDETTNRKDTYIRVWAESNTASNEGILLYDDNLKGARYAADYSAANAANPRWIPDKAYIDGAISGGSWALTGTSTITTPTIVGNPYFQGNVLIGPSGATITASTALDVRGIASGNAIRVASSGDSVRWVLKDTGLVSHTPPSVSGSSDVYTLTPAFSASSGTVTWRGIYINPSINSTGTATTVAVGFDYSPTVTGTTGLTHHAIRASAGYITIPGAGGTQSLPTFNFGGGGVANGSSTGLWYSSNAINFTTAAAQSLQLSGNNATFGQWDGGSISISVGGAGAGNLNRAGQGITINGGQGTGSGVANDIVFQTAPSGSSGTALNALVRRVTVRGETGQLYVGTYTVGTGVTAKIHTDGEVRAQGGFNLRAPNNSDNIQVGLFASTGGAKIVVQNADVADFNQVGATSTGGSYMTMGGTVNPSSGLSSAQTNMIRINTNFTPSGGAITYIGVNNNPTYNTSGTYGGTAIGFDHNPTLTSTTGLTHIAFRAVSGKSVFGGQVPSGIGTTTPLHVTQTSVGDYFIGFSNNATASSSLGGLIRIASGNVQSKWDMYGGFNQSWIQIAPTIVSTASTFGTKTTGVHLDIQDQVPAAADAIAIRTGQSWVQSSGTNAYTSLLVTPTYNTTSTYVGVSHGYHYNPTRTSVVGLTEYAIRTAGGQTLLGTSSSDAVTASTRLDVRGISGGNILRLSDNANTNAALVITNNGNVTFQSASGQWVSGGGNAFNFTTTYAPTSSSYNYEVLKINPILNTTGTYVGTARGIYYNPTLTSTTGLTHIAFESTSGNVTIGGSGEVTLLNGANNSIVLKNHGRIRFGNTTNAYVGLLTNGDLTTADLVYNSGGTHTFRTNVAPSLNAGNLTVYDFSGLGFNGSSGSNTGTLLKLSIPISISAGTAIIRGIYYNPTLTDLTGVASHIAFESTSGQIRFGGITNDDTKTRILGIDDTTGQLFYRTIGASVGGWTAATGTDTRTTFATGSVTTAQLAERMKALIDDLLSIGLIKA